jgi:hypothetical protein
MSNKYLYILWSILTALLLYFNVANNIKLRMCEHDKNNNEASNYIMFHNINHTAEIINSYNDNKDILRYVFLKQTDFPVLIYRYQQGICSPCFQEDLSVLYQLKDEIGTDRILIVPEYGDDKNSRLSMKSDLNHFNHRNVPSKYLQIPADSDGVRDKYFAVINKDGNIENVFFSKAGYQHLTKIYVNGLKNLLRERKTSKSFDSE